MFHSTQYEKNQITFILYTVVKGVGRDIFFKIFQIFWPTFDKCQEEMRYFRLTPPDMRLRPGVTVMTWSS